jgi:adenosylhomocysteine nucleosidase
MKIRIVGVILLAGALGARIFAGEKPGSIGILGAMAEEIKPIEEKFSNPKEYVIEQFRFAAGEIYGKSIVMARMGVGKVNASIISTLLVEHFKPSRVILTGFAGGINPDLLFGDIVIAENVAQHDLGILRKNKFELSGFKNPLDGQRSPIFYPADTEMLAQAEVGAEEIKLEKFRINEIDRIPKIVKGIIVTGGTLVFFNVKKKVAGEPSSRY